MKQYGNQILGTLVAFILTLILNFVSHIIFFQKGSIEISSYETVAGEKIAQIRVENYSSESLNGLKLLIPAPTRIQKITSTNSLRITSDSKGWLSNASQQLIEASLFPAKTITTLFIPIEKSTECCSVLNAAELKLEYKSGSVVENPLGKIFIDAALSASIYALFFGMLLFWGKNKRLEYDAQLDKLQDKLQEAQDQIEDAHKRFTEHVRTDARKQAILIRRLSDYSKELTFWRDTIRKALYGKTLDTSDAEKLLSAVTQTLKTFCTKERSTHEYEIAEALAETLIEFEGTHIKKEE